jgi:hypothetical protein
LKASSEWLASDGDHLCISSDDHLCTSGLPAVATTSACVPWRGGPRPRPHTGVRTRPSKNVATTPMAYDVLYDPPGSVGAAWPAVAGGAGGATGAVDLCTARPSPVRWTGSHAPLGGRRRRWRRLRGRQSQRDGAAAWLASHPKESGGGGGPGVAPRRTPLSTFTRLVIILPPECWRKKQEGALPPRTSRGGRR